MLARDTGFDAEQWVGLAFALVELGLAHGGVERGGVCGHYWISLKFSLPGLTLSRGKPAPTVGRDDVSSGATGLVV